MIGYLNICLRLAIWFLLTADFSPANIMIGIASALFLPRIYTDSSVLKDWMRALWETIVAIPQAYIEAVQIILRPHKEEDVTMERVKPGRTPGLIFLDIFIISFTPKTIVLKYHENGWYEVHKVQRRKQQ